MILRSCILIVAAAFPNVVSAAQPSAALPVSAPLRELPWGQLNFLHTTDTHGWHAGHLLEYASSKEMFLPLLKLKLDPPSAPTGVTIFPSHNDSMREPTKMG